MTENSAEHIRETLDRIYSSESRRILATLIRLDEKALSETERQEC